jgi:superfamily II DNA or RNA helicase
MTLFNTTKKFSYIKERVEKYKKEYNEKNEIVRLPQYIFEKIFFDEKLYNARKGMLAYFKPGTGKSILSINVGIKFLQKNPKSKILFLANKSLHANYLMDLKKYVILYNKKFKEDLSNYLNKIEFITLNAGNVKELITERILNNNLLIIDEAHNLFNAIYNHSDIGLYIYKTILNSKHVKLIFLTGTPVINTLYESFYCLNMLANEIILPTININIIPDPFNIKELDRRLKKIGNILFGLVSYHDTPRSYAQYFPEDLGISIIKCNLTKKQKIDYDKAKAYEEQILKMPKIDKDSILNLEKKLSGGNFYIYSRLAAIRSIKEDVLECIKYKKIMSNIKRLNRNAIIYSNFVNEYGLGGISEFLRKNDYECVNELTNIKYLNNIFRSKKKRFALFTGDVDPNLRGEIQKAFNNNRNKNGEYLQILLLSKTGAEGLDLKNIRSIHILEPHFNMSRIYQIKFRGIRYKSHENLSKIEQRVETFIYLSTLGINNYTVDEYIWDHANIKEKLNELYLAILKRYSIDCELNENVKCIKCLTNNKILKLYDENFITDIHMNNPCEDGKPLKILFNLFKTLKNDIYLSLITNKKYKIKENKLKLMH